MGMNGIYIIGTIGALVGLWILFILCRLAYGLPHKYREFVYRCCN
jgi:membrane protein DedA with SNARE-associated domain